MIETPSFVVEQNKDDKKIYVKDKRENKKRRVPKMVAEDAALDMYFHSLEDCKDEP